MHQASTCTSSVQGIHAGCCRCPCPPPWSDSCLRPSVQDLVKEQDYLACEINAAVSTAVYTLETFMAEDRLTEFNNEVAGIQVQVGGVEWRRSLQMQHCEEA